MLTVDIDLIQSDSVQFTLGLATKMTRDFNHRGPAGNKAHCLKVL